MPALLSGTGRKRNRDIRVCATVEGTILTVAKDIAYCSELSLQKKIN
jgi:dihydroxyacetone kinase-like predicted kinase